jgi:raffinose/stachyose/melibiose transport system permease protein
VSRGSRKLRQALLAAFLWMCTLVVLVPFVFVVITSLKDSREAGLFSLTLPAKFHLLDNYAVVFGQGRILQGFMNSILITSVSVALVLTCAALLSFYVARSRSKASPFLYYFFIMGMTAPLSLVTTFKLLSTLHLLSSRAGVILVFVGTFISFTSFLYVGFIKTIPRELDEAAVLDGCSAARIFGSVVLPLLTPVTSTCAIICFMGIWNDAQVNLFFLNNSDYWTMPLNIYRFFTYYRVDWNYVFGSIFLSTLPVLIIYVFGQRYIIEGMVAGSIKG